MNKTDFVAMLAEKAELSKKDSQKVFDAVLEGITEVLAKGESLIVPGFGTFTVKERPARTGRNPQTGQEIQIAAKKVASFKPGKGLSDAVGK